MVAFLIVIIILLLACHLILMESYRRWFLKVNIFNSDSTRQPATTFTVIIPARNEEDNIGKCLATVLNQNYPVSLFEVIVADDFSTDKTSEVVQGLQEKHSNLKLLQLEKVLGHKPLNSYKKKAIELCVAQASGDWIVTTDADCAVSKEWLLNFDSYIRETNAVFVAAPVKFTNTESFVSVFQCLDFMSLQGITAASVGAGFHTMCNGANVAYNKRVFYEVGGFKGIDNIASGDDMLLMHKVYVKYKKQVQFLFSPTSIVETLPMPTWRSFLNQRIRWASKADKFDDKRIMAVLIFIYTFNLLFIAVPVVAVFIPKLWLLFIVMLSAKTLIELRFMVPVAKFFNERSLLWWFPVMQPVHILYTVIAGWLGKFGKYSWKGRVVK